MKKLEDYIVSIVDFPVEGIIFRDITSVLEDADGFELAINELIDQVKELDFDIIVVPEARGFIFGSPIAYKLKKALVLARKKGKLPRETKSINYELEYGAACIEIHEDSIKQGQKVLVVDDLLATGGTIKGVCELVELSGGSVAGILTLIELQGLKGREKLAKYEVKSVISYEGN